MPGGGGAGGDRRPPRDAQATAGLGNAQLQSIS